MAPGCRLLSGHAYVYICPSCPVGARGAEARRGLPSCAGPASRGSHTRVVVKHKTSRSKPPRRGPAPESPRTVTPLTQHAARTPRSANVTHVAWRNLGATMIRSAVRKKTNRSGNTNTQQQHLGVRANTGRVPVGCWSLEMELRRWKTQGPSQYLTKEGSQLHDHVSRRSRREMKSSECSRSRTRSSNITVVTVYTVLKHLRCLKYLL